MDSSASSSQRSRPAGPAGPSRLLLLVEVFDELSYSIEAAALPALRAALGLSYAQVGLLIGIPGLVNTLIEPALMLFGDSPHRRRLILTGGLLVATSLLLAGLAQAFPALLLAFVLNYPASGAFVSLSQAIWVDGQRGREAQAMARWTIAGSLGDLFGPLILAGVLGLGLSWRPAFLTLAGFALVLTWLAARRLASPLPARADPPLPKHLLDNLRSALAAPGMLRWLTLLELADLMLDLFTAYASLYLADVVGLGPAQTALVVTGMMAAGLLADALVLPLLERIPPRRLVRLSALAIACLYPIWLLLPWPAAKIVLALVLRAGTLGWYPVLQAEAYAAAPGKPGAVMALNSACGVLGAGLAALIGIIAARAGLATAMWILLAGPLALLAAVPAPRPGDTISTAASHAGGSPPDQ